MTVPGLPSIDNQRRFWDWHWRNWEDRKTVNEWKHKRHEAILSLVKSVAAPNSAILDVGCGPGWYTDKLSQFGNVTGMDLSEEAIAMARSRFPHITFIAGNIYNEKLPLNHFDLVVCQEVIDHVEDSSALVERIASVLKPGGYFILSCTNKFVVDRLDDRDFPPQPSDHIGRYFDTKGLKALLRNKFQVLGLDTVVLIGHRGILRLVNSVKLNNLLRAVVPSRLLDRLKGQAGFGYQIIALSQKRKSGR